MSLRVTSNTHKGNLAMENNKIVMFIKEILNNGISKNKLKQFLRKKHKDIYDEIILKTKDICTSSNPTIFECLYILEHNILHKNDLLCPVCKKNYRKFFFKSYRGWCSSNCMVNDPNIHMKMKQTRLHNHHGKYVDDEILSKKQQTCLDKYGVTSFSKTQDFLDKGRKTRKERYGDENFNNSEQMLKTKEQRYGSKNYNNRKKAEQTFFDRYGVYAPSQIPAVRMQQKKTCLEQCGSETYLTVGICAEYSSKSSYEKMMNNEYDEPAFSYDEYKNRTSQLLKFKCRKCNSEFYSVHHDGIHNRCSKCYPPTRSKAQTEICNYILEFTKNVITNSRSIIFPYEIDIYIPDYKLAIEFDGLFWHSTQHGIDQKYHIRKTILCEQQGIQLIHIFENEWMTKKDNIKSYIKSLLTTPIILSHNYEIKFIDEKFAESFQKKYSLVNCFTNYNSIQRHIGLFIDKNLIQMLSFSKKSNSFWKITDFIFKYHISNSLQLMLLYFKNNCQPNMIQWIIDRRWNNGSFCYDCGFNLIEEINPQLWYWTIKNHKPIMISNNEILQKNIVNLNKFNCIYDCGSLVFQKDFKHEIA